MARKGTLDLGYLRSPCPIAGALDFLGDKWTLVIVRDLVVGKRRYGDFEKSPEKIPTNILADRLRQLENHGIIRKTPYQTRPLRHEYRLTKKGADLLPILQAMARWSSTYVGGCALPPDWFFKLTAKDVDRE